MKKRCKNYVGVSCVDGSCPRAIAEEHEEMAISKVTCEDCYCYRGCEDCALNGTEHCVGGVGHGQEQGE